MKSRILRLLYAVLLLVSITFAWILTGDVNRVPSLSIDYKDDGTLQIANMDVNASIWIYDSTNDTYIAMPENYQFDSNSMIPGATVPFRIRIENNSESVIRANLTLYIDVDEADFKLLDKLFIEIAAGNGYYGVHVDPVNIKFSDAVMVQVDGEPKYALSIYNAESLLAIPLTAAGSYAELNCSFYFDESADAAYQDLSFVIDYFRMEQ